MSNKSTSYSVEVSIKVRAKSTDQYESRAVIEATKSVNKEMELTQKLLIDAISNCKVEVLISLGELIEKEIETKQAT